MPISAVASPTFDNALFDQGVATGMLWNKTGDVELRRPTAELIVRFIKNNMLEPEFEEWKNDEELLLHHAGFLIGWVLGEYCQ